MNRDELDTLWRDNQNWRFYLTTYKCPQDPRLFVKKRDTFGWTANFGHRLAIPLFFLMLGTICLPLLVLILWRDDQVGIVTTLGLIALVIATWLVISIRNERGRD